MRRVLCVLFACLALMAGPAFAEENLLKNGGFEEAQDGWPRDWLEEAWLTDEGISYLELSEDAHGGLYAAMIENVSTNDARFVQPVAVEPNTVYRLFGSIRAEGCDPALGGANLSVEGDSGDYPAVFDTGGQWEPVECYVRTAPDQREMVFAARLGFYGKDTAGKAWFDDLSVTRVDEPPTGARVITLQKAQAPAAGNQTEAKPASKSVDMFIWTAAFAALVIAAYILRGKRVARPAALFCFVLGFAAVVRLYLMATQPGYATDMSCFFSWARHMAEVGPADFYETIGFCDYPPGYILVLWLPGKLLQMLGISEQTGVARVIVKLYPMLADLGAVGMLFALSRKRLGDKNAMLLSLLYAFSPAVLIDGAVWGQMDAVLALGLLATVAFAAENRWQFALPVYVATVLMKPQALMVAPVGVMALLFFALDKETRRDALIRAGNGLAVSVALAAVMLAPFLLSKSEPLAWLIAKYTDTLGSYQFATLNTANLYYLMGANWTLLDQPIVGSLTFGTVGLVTTILSVVSVIALYALRRSRDNLPFFCALALIALYLFGMKMHERYLFPALVLLLYAYIRRPDKRLLALFVGFSVTFFLNVATVLRDVHLAVGFGLWGMLLASVNLALFGLAVWVARDRRTLPLLEPPEAAPAPEDRLPALDGRTPGMPRLRLIDWALMLALTAAYGAVAFVGLGSTVAPQTVWKSTGPGESVVFDLGELRGFEVMFYGEISSQSFSMAFSEDGNEWTDPYDAAFGYGDCFKWKYLCGVLWSDRDHKNVSNESPMQFSARYARMTADGPGVRVMEVAFKDLDGNLCPVASVTGEGGREENATDPRLLVDEQNTVPDAPSYLNSMYFDEIYHGRTGYEHLHQMTTYETTHPPLGKIFIMWGIRLFGMTPFGWRFMGALMGVLMVPAMYLMGLLLLKKTKLAFLAAFLMAFDMMHLTQTRIATIDSYAVFFIILMYLCMFRYLQMSFFRDGWRTLLPLGFSGLFMGLGCASKWICIYAGAGLAVLFFWAMWQRYQEYRAGLAAGDEMALRVQKYPAYLLGTLGACVAFFLVVPGLIYYFSYIPYFAYSGGLTLKKFIDAQTNMFSYHANLVDDHAFASPWYEWPLILKPMYYYTGAPYTKTGIASTIMAMGNPAVWWVGFAALIATFWRWLKPHLRWQRVTDARPALLLLAFTAQFLPWVIVPRSMFIYHYFGSLPFVIMMTALWFEGLHERRPKRANVIQAVYMGLTVLLFVAFYPVATGVTVPADWIDAVNWLRFLKLPGAHYRGWLYY